MITKVFTTFFIGAASCLLSGCYVSTQPLIARSAADYPLPDGARFAAFAPAGKDWRPQAGRTLHRNGAYYTYTTDGEDKQSPPFLLKRIAPKSDLYIAQMNDRSDPKQVSEYYYGLIQFDGKTAVQHQATCPTRPDWVTRGLADKIENTASPRCLFSDFGKLATALQEAAKNEAPEMKFVLGK
jgi:hypothetical protein